MTQPATSSRAVPDTKVVAQRFHEEDVGKTLSRTKQRYEWHITIGDVPYEICFTYSSLSGKRQVMVNQRTVYQETQFRGSNFTHSWSLEGHSLSILPKWAMKDEVYRSFDLSVDGRPFDVLLNSGGEELQLPKLKIEIFLAQGLPGGKVDPYCTCEIPGAHGSMFSTKICSKTSDPVWNHEHTIADYVPGEPLKFCVVDKGTNTWMKSESSIGEGTLSSEQFYPFGFDGILRLSSSLGQFTLKVKVSASDTPEERLLRDIFDRCDQNRDGSLNKRELIKALRIDEDVADFFNLPQQIRQEDGSRDEMERIFQEMDTNSDREISWEEFQNFFARKSKAGEPCAQSRSPRSHPASPELATASPRGGGRTPRDTSPRRRDPSPSPVSPSMSSRTAPASTSPDLGKSADAATTPKTQTRDRLDSSSTGSATRSPKVQPRERAETTSGAFLDGLLEPPKAGVSRRTQSDSVHSKKDKTKKTKSPKLPAASAFDDLGAFGGFDGFSESGGSPGSSGWPQEVSWPTPGAESLSPSESTLPPGGGWPGFESSPRATANATTTPKSSPKVTFATPVVSDQAPAPTIFGSSKGLPFGKSASSPSFEQTAAGVENPLVKSTSSPNFEQGLASASSHGNSPKQGIGSETSPPQEFLPEVAPSRKLTVETRGDAVDPAGNFAQAERNLFDGFQENGWPDTPNSPITRQNPNRLRAQTHPPSAPVHDSVFGEQGSGNSPEDEHSAPIRRPLVVGSPQIPFPPSGKSPSPLPPVAVTSPQFKTASPSERPASRMRAQTDYPVVDPWGNTYSPSLPASQTVVVDPWGYKYAK